jgi:hypothetical protein
MDLSEWFGTEFGDNGWFGGGGGGCTYSSGVTTPGGQGGGGVGTNVAGGNGMDGTGGGGGGGERGAATAGSTGGSGIVLIHWRAVDGIIQAFTEGTSTFDAGAGGYADIFMIGGGGGTGFSRYHNGGGGAGGAVLALQTYLPPGETYEITVGAGGTGGTVRYGGQGTNGGDTTGFGWVAKGGGEGASYLSLNQNSVDCAGEGCASPGGCGGGGGGSGTPWAGATSNQPSYGTDAVLGPPAPITIGDTETGLILGAEAILTHPCILSLGNH